MALDFGVPDSELSMTLHNRRAEIVDNIFQGTPFLKAMREMNGVMVEDGGLELVRGLRLSKNTTAGSFSGFDILDTTPQDNETSAKYPWANEYATISLAWDQVQKNKGKGKLIDLQNQKTDDALESVKDKTNVHFLQAQPAAGSKDPASITEIVDVDPTADPPRTSSIGSIGNANTWWRNKTLNGGAFAVADWNTMYNNVSDGSDPPTFLLTSQTVFEYYENSQVGQIRYTDSRMADAGFDSLVYKSKPVIWDPQIGITDATYFLNTKYFEITLMQGADFVTTDFVEPDNQAAKVAKILAMLQLCSTNRRRLGVVHSITAPA